jgi:hypothetical protein
MSMSLSPERWKEISPSRFPWERDALNYIRTGLPDCEPYRAWSNFEFVADDGTINEVDLLVFTPQGFFLVEIKGRPGVITGDSHTWRWKNDRGERVSTIRCFSRTEKQRNSSLSWRESRLCEILGYHFSMLSFSAPIQGYSVNFREKRGSGCA